MDPSAISDIAVRFAHVFGIVLLLGPVFYARVAGVTISEKYRPVLYLGMITVLGSGFAQFMAKHSYPKGYHMWFGIKMLLVMHIFAILSLIATGRGDAAKQKRWLIGLAFSGMLTMLIGQILRAMPTA